MSYQRILLATDFSDQSGEAARVAKLMGDDKTRYRVVHATALADLPARVDLNADVQRSNLAAWCEKVGITTHEQAVLHGGVSKEITREAEAMEADLIVLGDTGRNKVERLLLGSTARGVVRLAQCDTLVVRANQNTPAGAPFRNFLVATDFFEPSARAAARAVWLAKAFDASLNVAHAVDPDIWQQALRTPPDQLANAPEWLDQTYGDMLHKFNQEHLDGKAKEHLTRGNPARAIAEHARLQNTDLLILGTHGARGVERLLLGAHAEALIERAPCSVLVVR